MKYKILVSGVLLGLGGEMNALLPAGKKWHPVSTQVQEVSKINGATLYVGDIIDFSKTLPKKYGRQDFSKKYGLDSAIFKPYFFTSPNNGMMGAGSFPTAFIISPDRISQKPISVQLKSLDTTFKINFNEPKKPLTYHSNDIFNILNSIGNPPDYLILPAQAKINRKTISTLLAQNESFKSIQWFGPGGIEPQQMEYTISFEALPDNKDFIKVNLEAQQASGPFLG